MPHNRGKGVLPLLHLFAENALFCQTPIISGENTLFLIAWLL
jgi:hypothetical protein